MAYIDHSGTHDSGFEQTTLPGFPPWFPSWAEKRFYPWVFHYWTEFQGHLDSRYYIDALREEFESAKSGYKTRDARFIYELVSYPEGFLVWRRAQVEQTSHV